MLEKTYSLYSTVMYIHSALPETVTQLIATSQGVSDCIKCWAEQLYDVAVLILRV